jgi:hypothetical protein
LSTIAGDPFGVSRFFCVRGRFDFDKKIRYNYIGE